MAKKYKRLLALVMVFTIMPLSPLSAAVKAGAPCAKVGAKSVAIGKTYTCIKSGKKLIWNKGVKQKTSSASSPSQTLTNVPVNGGDPFAQFGKDAARFKAVDDYGKLLASGRKLDVQQITSLLESPNDELVVRMTANAQYAYSVYEQILPLGYIPKWAVGDSSDWLKTNVVSICPNFSAVRPNSGGASCRMTAVWRGVETRNDPITQNLMLVQGGHEIFHLYQQELWGRYWNVVPDWIREGTASLGMGITVTHFDNQKSFPNYGLAQKVERNPKDKASCEQALNKWEKNQPADGFGANKGCEYGLGMLMNEYLVLKGHTLNDHLELIRLIGTGIDFPNSFSQVYKMSTADFFSGLRSYLATLDYGW
jgi:hypothetical protein